jgi:hypothetical protein
MWDVLYKSSNGFLQMANAVEIFCRLKPVLLYIDKRDEDKATLVATHVLKLIVHQTHDVKVPQRYEPCLPLCWI